MQEQRYHARDKTVKKMSRDGLTEENLRSNKNVRVSRREADWLEPFTDHNESRSHFQNDREVKKGRRYAAYQKGQKAGLTIPGNAGTAGNVSEPAYGVLPDTGDGKADRQQFLSSRQEETKGGGKIPVEAEQTGSIPDSPIHTENIRQRPSSFGYMEAAARHNSRKKMVQEYGRRKRAGKESETTQAFEKEQAADTQKETSQSRQAGRSETGEKVSENVAEEKKHGVSAHSIRMESIRQRPVSDTQTAHTDAETRHNFRRKMVQDYGRKERAGKESETTQDSEKGQAADTKKETSRLLQEGSDNGVEASFGVFSGKAEEESRQDISEYPARMGSIRGHPVPNKEPAAAVGEARHGSEKKVVQDYARKEGRTQVTLKTEDPATVPEAGMQKEAPKQRLKKAPEGQTLEDFRDGIRDKAKMDRLNKEQRKSSARLSFGDEENGMVRGAGMGIAKKTVSAAALAASVYAHGKANEADQDNTAVESAHRAELVAEGSIRRAMHRANRGLHGRNSRLQKNCSADVESGRLIFRTPQEEAAAVEKTAAQGKEKSRQAKKYWQKRRYQKSYLAAKRGRQEAQETVRVTETVFAKARRAAAAAVRNNKGIFLGVAMIALLFVLIGVSFSSCGALLQGQTASIAGTAYLSTDEDIYAVEDAYTALENALNEQVNNMESAHPGYDEYRYQVDEISHNPYHLISYFTAKYGEFTYEQVKDEAEEIFREQYQLTTQETSGTETETRTVRVGESLGPVVTSGYCSCAICCGPWAGSPTASGVYPTADHTLAVDVSNPFVPMGTKIVMNGVEYVVEDTGTFAQYGVQFDVYYDSHEAASAHGHQTWEAYIADDNGQQEVEVTSTRQVNRLDVTLTNHSLDAVLRSRMDDEESKRYDLYNTTLGQRNYLFGINTMPDAGAGGFGYEIPAEALSDQKFANMIGEAQKYLGYPYVWGGSSPDTSFDCSGFVSWVINHCGNGWNIGRCTAEELRGHCAYVSPEQAKPGDLIFFQGTYDTAGASHVGIYVGNNMMLHCGNPIQYANIASSYWQQHFMAFGRIQ